MDNEKRTSEGAQKIIRRTPLTTILQQRWGVYLNNVNNTTLMLSASGLVGGFPDPEGIKDSGKGKECD
ncbi:unnamed protein product, partial [Nesidiocoris tenuis]